MRKSVNKQVLIPPKWNTLIDSYLVDSPTSTYEAETYMVEEGDAEYYYYLVSLESNLILIRRYDDWDVLVDERKHIEVAIGITDDYLKWI